MGYTYSMRQGRTSAQPVARHGVSGQAVTEYIAIACLCMLVVLGAMAYFLDNVGDFYLNVVRIVCLPFP